ncbi:hypothetical protein ACP70R_016065 [Stipagrostis hirtigluma subsp. patula]
MDCRLRTQAVSAPRKMMGVSAYSVFGEVALGYYKWKDYIIGHKQSAALKEKGASCGTVCRPTCSDCFEM